MARRLFVLAALICVSCGSSPSGPGSQPQGPNLVSPADGSSVTGPDVSFTWDAWTGATKYYHQLALDSTMQNAVTTVVTTTGATVTPGSTGIWWWRVRASVTGMTGYTPWSQAWSFTLN